MNDSRNITANPEIVKAGTDYLLETFDEYLKGHPIPSTDCFMICHNFHRIMIMAIARQLEPQIPYRRTLRMADMTWRNSIREMWRNEPNSKEKE